MGRQTLQKIVLAVNQWPLGLHFTRVPYYVAVRALGWMLKKYPLMLSAYARNSFALGSWTPGRSDIDLTLILRADESLQSEFITLNRFWNAYASLQRWFPMLGEVEILNQAHFEAWMQFSITGFEARHWICIYGTDVDRSGYRGGEEQRKYDRLSHAISIYCHQMVPVIRSAHPDSLLRYTQKILRYLDAPADAATTDKLAGMTREELQATVVRKLESSLPQQNAWSQQGPDLELNRLLGINVAAVVQKGPEPALLSRDALVIKELSAVVRSPSDHTRGYYIPREHLDLESLARCIAVANADDGTAVVMPRSLLLHYLQFVDPLEYLALLQNRMILWGCDPLAHAQPWPERVFNEAVCASCVHILTLPYRREVARQTQEQFRHMLLGWVLRMTHYFQEGVMEFDYDRLIASWQQLHPDSDIAGWQGRLDGSERRFEFLRTVADIISEDMMNY